MSKQRSQLWRIDDVAEMASMSTRSVRRWIETGELAAHKFGKSVRIDDGDLKAFIAIHRSKK